jgi:hypothetical protein
VARSSAPNASTRVVALAKLGDVRPAVGWKKAPHRAPGIHRITARETARTAQNGVCAVRRNDQVERAVFVAGVVDESSPVFAQPLDAHAGMDRGEVRAGRMQQREQRAASHA